MLYRRMLTVLLASQVLRLVLCRTSVAEARLSIIVHLQAIEVPETLLKKRKQNEKAREERLLAATAARKVSHPPIPNQVFYYDAYDHIDNWLV